MVLLIVNTLFDIWQKQKCEIGINYQIYLYNKIIIFESYKHLFIVYYYTLYLLLKYLI